jgi:Fe-S cluster biosynthesis and repair protein YggX
MILNKVIFAEELTKKIVEEVCRVCYKKAKDGRYIITNHNIITKKNVRFRLYIQDQYLA